MDLIDRTQFREQIQDIITKNIEPYITEWENNRTIPPELFKLLGQSGLNGITVPQELGGLGQDIISTLIFSEELLLRNATGVASSLMIQANTVAPLLFKNGSDFIIEHYLKPMLVGDRIVSLAVTEPDGGSDLVRAVKTTATLEGDTWVINGEKMFITNAPIANTFIVLAKTRMSENPLSMSLFIVDLTEDITVEPLKKMGQLSSPVGRIIFNNCRVPATNLLGKKNTGYMLVNNALYEERFLIGYASIYLAKVCLEKTINHLKNRFSKGKPLINYQAISHQLSFYTAEVDACITFAQKEAIKISQGNIDKTRATMVKYKLCEVAQSVVSKCLKLHGSFGLYADHWIEQMVRDIRITSVYAGTSETMKDLVSKNMIPQMYKKSNSLN